MFLIYLSVSVYLLGGWAWLGGETCQFDPVQRPGHQSPAGRNPGWADEGYSRLGLCCQAHKQTGSAPQTSDYPPNKLHHSYFFSCWEHWDHSHHYVQWGAAAWQSAARCSEAQQHGGWRLTSRVWWVVQILPSTVQIKGSFMKFILWDFYSGPQCNQIQNRKTVQVSSTASPSPKLPVGSWPHYEPHRRGDRHQQEPEGETQWFDIT